MLLKSVLFEYPVQSNYLTESTQSNNRFDCLRKIVEPMYPRCPVCEDETFLKYAINDYEILNCRYCGHQFIAGNRGLNHIAQTYNDDYFFGGNAGYPNYLAEADLLISQGQQYSQILTRHVKPGRLLDVGCAAGFTLKGFVADGWLGHGIEPNKNMVEFGRKNLGLDINYATLETIETSIKFDVVCLIQVIGHFYNLQQAIRNVADITRSNGYCLVEYWDRSSFIAELLGKHWHEYSPPSVLHWFAMNDLNYLFSQFGFKKVANGSPKKYILGAHVRSLLDYKIRPLPLGKYIVNGLKVIPSHVRFRYPAIDLEWMLFRKEN